MPNPTSYATLTAAAVLIADVVADLDHVYLADTTARAHTVEVCICEHPATEHDIRKNGDRGRCDTCDDGGRCLCPGFVLGFWEHTLVTRIRVQAGRREHVSAAGLKGSLIP